jgi:hypothetical protein
MNPGPTSLTDPEMEKRSSCATGRAREEPAEKATPDRKMNPDRTAKKIKEFFFCRMTLSFKNS